MPAANSFSQALTMTAAIAASAPRILDVEHGTKVRFERKSRSGSYLWTYRFFGLRGCIEVEAKRGGFRAREWHASGMDLAQWIDREVAREIDRHGATANRGLSAEAGVLHDGSAEEKAQEKAERDAQPILRDGDLVRLEGVVYRIDAGPNPDHKALTPVEVAPAVVAAAPEKNSPEAAREALLAIHAHRGSGIVGRTKMSPAALDFARRAGWLTPMPTMRGAEFAITPTGRQNAAEFAPEIRAMDAPASDVFVPKGGVAAVSSLRFVVDASDLGLRPGQLERSLRTDLGNGNALELRELADDGSLIYRQRLGVVELVVLND